MTVALFLLLLGVEPIDEIPLHKPLFPVDPPAQTAAATARFATGVEATDAGPGIADKHLHLGLKVAADLGSAALRGGGGGVLELGGRLPVWRARLGLMLEGGVFDLVASNGAANALLVQGNALLTWHEAAGPGLLRVLLGPTLNWLNTTVNGVTAVDQYLTAGFCAGLGYVLAAGPGGVVFELRYRLAPQVVAQAVSLSQGAFAAVGYSFFVLR